MQAKPVYGMDDYLARMSVQEKKDTLLVIDLNSLIVGDRLYFNGMNTPAAVRKQTSARACRLRTVTASRPPAC